MKHLYKALHNELSRTYFSTYMEEDFAEPIWEDYLDDMRSSETAEDIDDYTKKLIEYVTNLHKRRIVTSAYVYTVANLLKKYNLYLKENLL